MSIKRYKQTEDGGLYPLTDEDHDYESAPWVKFADHQWYVERAKLDAERKHLPEREGYVSVPREPYCGHEYEIGNWSRRNYEAYLRDQESAPK